MTSITIACPYPLDAKMGNVVTARRLAGILTELNYVPRLCHGWDGKACDVLLVLNAVKGAQAVREFCEAYPERPIIVVLTGTDLYRDLNDEAKGGMEILAKATRVVVMTEEAPKSLPMEIQEKTLVIPQSLEIPEITAERDEDVFGVSILGHLRAVKNPFQVIEILSRHPEWESVRVWQAGAAMTEKMTSVAREWETKDWRYQWLGELPREGGLKVLMRSHVLINSSLLEGAPSAILEAMHLGVPVLASAVEGNIGLLGADYEGLFEPENDSELETLLSRGQNDPEFLGHLRSHGSDRFGLFSREREKEGWKRLLVGL